MRLIATLQDDKQALLLSNYLKSQDIDNECEISISTDWGDEQYKIPICRIWIRDEEHLQAALEIARDFQENSSDPKFQPYEPKKYPPAPDQNLKVQEKEKLEAGPRSAWREESMGLITLILLSGCCLLFFLIDITTPLPDAVLNKVNFLPQASLHYPPLEKSLLFDYPKHFEIADQLIEKIESEHITNFEPLPNGLAPLYKQMEKTPYWQGYYEKIVNLFEPLNSSKSSLDVPIFEKIKQGEWWRLITPAFLHAGLLHLFFNMIWLMILGKQLEQRLGSQRYLFFVILTAVLTNTSQYLMSGFNFVGFSGVICGMIAFVWVRQKKTPWEGYLLQTSTVNFTMLFLISFLLLQMVSFYTEIVYKQPLAASIANTAHMAGLLIGAILGNLDFFAWKNR